MAKVALTFVCLSVCLCRKCGPGEPKDQGECVGKSKALQQLWLVLPPCRRTQLATSLVWDVCGSWKWFLSLTCDKSFFSLQSEFDVPFTVKAGQIGEFLLLLHRLLPQCHLVAALLPGPFPHVFVVFFYLIVCVSQASWRWRSLGRTCTARRWWPHWMGSTCCWYLEPVSNSQTRAPAAAWHLTTALAVGWLCLSLWLPGGTTASLGCHPCPGFFFFFTAIGCQKLLADVCACLCVRFSRSKVHKSLQW